MASPPGVRRSTVSYSSPMGHSGSIPPASFSFSTSFGHHEVNDPFGNTYSEGGPYAVDLTLPPQSRVGRLTRHSSSSSRSLNRGSSDSLLDTRSVGKPTTNAGKDEGSLRRSFAPPSTSREDQTTETREHGHIRGRSEDAHSETLSDFLNSSGEHSSPSLSSPSISSKEEPSTREMQSIVAESPEASSSPVGGARVMTFDQLELPSDLSSSEAASEVEEQTASVHVDVKEVTDGGSPPRPPADEKPSVAAAVGGRGRSLERPRTPEQLPRPATDDPNNSVVQESQELERESWAADDTIDPAEQRGLPSPTTETRSVEISYADEAFEEESSVFVHDDTFASTDDAAVATAKSQLEVPTPRSVTKRQTPRSSPRSARRPFNDSGRSPRVRTRMERGVQVDGLPQSVGIQYEPPAVCDDGNHFSHCSGRCHHPCAAAAADGCLHYCQLVGWRSREPCGVPPLQPPAPPQSVAASLEMVNELLDEAFKEQLSLLRSAASQQRDALHALLPSGMHPRSFVP